MPNKVLLARNQGDTLRVTRRSFLAAAALGVVGRLVLPAHADTPSQARRTLQTAYNLMNTGLARKNLKAAFAYLDPEYADIVGDLQLSLDEVRDMTAQLFRAARSIKATTHIDKLGLSGNEATATAKTRATIKVSDPQSGEVALLVMTSVSRDFWVKGSKGWRLLRSRMLSRKLSLNGESIPLYQQYRDL